MRALRWTVLGLALLLLAALLAVLWALNSQSGAAWIVDTAQDVLGDRLTIKQISGTISGPLTVRGIEYRDPQSGLVVNVAEATVDVALLKLPRWRVHVNDALISGVQIQLGEQKEQPEEDARPFSLDPPIDIVVDRFVLKDARIARADAPPLLVLNSAQLSGQWTTGGVHIHELDVRSPDGAIRITGNVDEQQDAFIGEANGEFRWRVGQQEYAGKLEATGDHSQAKANVHLSLPFDAQLQAVIGQQNTMPWTFDLSVPAFDPRRRLAPDGALQRLAATLKGEGDRSSAQITGEVGINDERVLIQPLRASMQDKLLRIEALTLRDAKRRGTLNVAGTVDLNREPLFANLTTQWKDVEIADVWAGQTLASHGHLDVAGNPEDYKAFGALALGPPGQLSNIEVAVEGSPQLIQIGRLVVQQERGRLAASGRVQIQPELAWSIDASATNFNPGAFLAEWPGRLGFKLASQGQITPRGPNASLTLENLKGTLRDRPISGEADLTLSPENVAAGTLLIRSGGSVVRIAGERGTEMALSAAFTVASLDDWIPDARGTLSGDFDVSGQWPKITIKGNATGRKLALAETSVRSVDVRLEATDIEHPQGSIALRAADAVAAGFEFASISFQGDGSDADHTFELNVDGKPLSASLRAQGKRIEQGWQGTLQALQIAVEDTEQVTLQQPVLIALAGSTFSVSETCLAGNHINICLAAQRNEAGELQARYALGQVPLAWIAAVAKPDLGLALEGMLEGQGEIRRSPDGAMFGNAMLSSASGSVSDAEDTTDPLVSYRNLQVTAELQGESARASASMAFVEGGNLSAEVLLSDLLGPSPGIQGNGGLSIQDIAPVSIFVPQLADLHGRASARVSVSGTLEEPQITGSATVQALTAELPVVGIKLRDGEVQASMEDGGNVTLSAQITSGEGQLALQGSGNIRDTLNITASGKNVLAANIPGATVLVTPDLRISRTPERIDITGKVLVPEAQVDLTKLPRGGGGQNISPDVVVVDADDKIERSQETPIHANVTVVIGEGEKVTLVGFGLDATVEGQLVVRETPGSETLGSGEVRLSGTYKAYGQDLTIERGRLLFANSPLANPQLDIVAFRKVQNVTARLLVTGTAQSPVLDVSADPAMSPTQALSYLVAGRPLDEIGTGSGEGDMVQSAARSLGGAAGNLLAKSLGRRLGVDQIGIENSEEIGGSAFTIGEYLSPRLYLSYGVGLFEPGQIVTLRYEISRRLAIEVRQGSESQRAGIQYRVER